LKEKDLYPILVKWFHKVLSQKFKNAKIEVYDTSQIELSRLLQKLKLQREFPEYLAYSIKVDITAIIKKTKDAELAFIECKLGNITLKDVSQLLGYSIVAKPYLSIIISPKTISRPLHHLLVIHRKYDVLHYEINKKIKIMKWNLSKNSIDHNCTLPPGEHI